MAGHHRTVSEITDCVGDVAAQSSQIEDGFKCVLELINLEESFK